MTSSLSRRIFLAHLELSYRLGRKVTLAEFGEMVATQMQRETPFTAAAVSRWEAGIQLPSPDVIEAIAAVTRTDPGWISHGDKTAAPPPARAVAVVADVGAARDGERGEVQRRMPAERERRAEPVKERVRPPRRRH